MNCLLRKKNMCNKLTKWLCTSWVSTSRWQKIKIIIITGWWRWWWKLYTCQHILGFYLTGESCGKTFREYFIFILLFIFVLRVKVFIIFLFFFVIFISQTTCLLKCPFKLYPKTKSKPKQKLSEYQRAKGKKKKLIKFWKRNDLKYKKIYPLKIKK